MITLKDIYAWLDSEAASSTLNGAGYTAQQMKDMLGLACASIASRNHPGAYHLDTRAEHGDEALGVFLGNAEQKELDRVMRSLGYSCHEVDSCQYEYFKDNTRATISVDGPTATHVGIDVVVPAPEPAEPEPTETAPTEEPLVGADLFKAALADYTELMGKVLGMGTGRDGLMEIARQLNTTVEVNGIPFVTGDIVTGDFQRDVDFFRIESYKHLGYIYFHIHENCIEVSFDVFQTSNDDNPVLDGVSPKDLIEELCKA